MKVGDLVRYPYGKLHGAGIVVDMETKPQPEGERDLYLYTIVWQGLAPPTAFPRRIHKSKEWGYNLVRYCPKIDTYV
jgi:hypothetical protein|tara:strand:+ start:476 stop:706 length:231 start_codon:yes stop_codon:yes gene_type:complete